MTTFDITSRDRFAAVLAGVRIGDARGFPFESMTHEQILAVTGSEGVTKFWAPQQTGDAPPWAMKMRTLPPEHYTDDWQCTRASARSSIAHQGFDLVDQARVRIDEMNTCRIGWGGTTVCGLRQIEQYLESDGNLGRKPGLFAPEMPPEVKDGAVKTGVGAGNGVVMCIGPVALLNVDAFDGQGFYIYGRIDTFMQMVWDFGGLTHPDPRATYGAFAVAALIAVMANRKGKPLNSAQALALLGWTNCLMRSMELRYAPSIPWARDLESLSSRLNLIQHLIYRDESASVIRTTLGTSSFVMQSVPFSIATFLRHPTDFEAAIKEAVEAGGDTDTNAAIVGSLVGANVGINNIPEEMRRITRGPGEAEDLGYQLFDLVHART